MARINNKNVYAQDSNVSGEDYLIGTDSITGETKTFTINSILGLGLGTIPSDTFATVSGNIITFPSGDTLEVPIDTDTDTFATINSGIITFANGDVIDLGTIDTDTFATISGDILTLSNGDTYDLTDDSASLTGSVITFPDGQTITVPNSSTDDQMASEVPVQTSGFGNNLEITDDTVQKALDRINALNLGSGSNSIFSLSVANNQINLLQDGNVISSENLPLNQADFNETDTLSPAFILNKPSNTGSQDESDLPLVNDYSPLLSPTEPVSELIASGTRVNLEDGQEFVTFVGLTGQQVIDLIDQPTVTEVIARFVNPNTGEEGYVPVILNNPNGNTLLIDSFSYVSTSTTSSYTSTFYGSGFFWATEQDAIDKTGNEAQITSTFPIDGSVDLDMYVSAIPEPLVLNFQEDFNEAIIDYIDNSKISDGSGTTLSNKNLDLGGNLNKDATISLENNTFRVREFASGGVGQSEISLGNNSAFIGAPNLQIEATTFTGVNAPRINLQSNGNIQINGSFVQIGEVSSGTTLGFNVTDTQAGGDDLTYFDVRNNSLKAIRYFMNTGQLLNITHPNDIPNKKYVDDAISGVSTGGTTPTLQEVVNQGNSVNNTNIYVERDETGGSTLSGFSVGNPSQASSTSMTAKGLSSNFGSTLILDETFSNGVGTKLTYEGVATSELFLRQNTSSNAGAQFNGRVSGLDPVNGGDFVTKSYADSNYSGGGATSTGLEAIDEGNGVGWRLIGANAAAYGNIGVGAVDVSTQLTVGTGQGSTGNYSHTEGFANTASGNNSHAEGSGNLASGENSHAEGLGTTASGDKSHAGGSNTTASGENSKSWGNFSVASGESSTAFGSDCNATELNSTAFGRQNTASGLASVAMGYLNTASGRYSTSMGLANTSSGFFSTSMGSSAEATGVVSIAAGEGVVARAEAEVAVGTYNTDYTATGSATDTWTATDRVFSVGNGQKTAGSPIRSDAFTIYKNGGAVFHPVALASITNPQAGMLITDSSDGNKLKHYNGTVWNDLY